MRRLNAEIIMALVIAFLIVLNCFIRKPTTIVVFDKKAITEAFIKELSIKTVDEKKIEQLTVRFVAILKKDLKVYAIKHRVLILKKECVLEGRYFDISGVIALQVQKDLRGGQ